MSSKMLSIGLLTFVSCALAAPVASPSGTTRFPFTWWNPEGVSECLAALPSDGSVPHHTGRGRFCGGRPSGSVFPAAAAAQSAGVAAPAPAAPAAEAPAAAAPPAAADSTQVVTDISYITDVKTVVVTPSPSPVVTSAEAIALTTSVSVASTPVAPVVEAPSGEAVSTVFASSVAPSAIAAIVNTVQNAYSRPSRGSGSASSSPAAAAPAPAASSPAAPAAASPAAPAYSSAAAAPPSGGSSGSGGKRGVPYNTASFVNSFSGGKVSWAYNWGSSSAGLSSSFEYVPMLWGAGSHATNFAADAAKALAAGSKHLLGFNEPDHPEQANLSPAAAATAYKTLFSDPFSGKAKLGAPAVTNGGGSMGLTWLGSFLGACSGCTIDFVPIHWYDSATNIQYFKDHVTKAHTMTGKPIWITEFGASGSDAQIDTFLQAVIPWMESQDWIERYSYFMASNGLLCNNGGLSSYGKTYNSL